VTPCTFDPFDASQVQSSWPALAEMRRHGPVAPLSDGMAYVTRHRECQMVLLDTDHFSSASGFKAPGVVVDPADHTLGELDPPQHGPVRRVMMSVLVPKVVKQAEPFVRATAEALLARRPHDLVAGFTVPLPNAVTIHLLGLPAEDAGQIGAWAKELMESGFPATNRTARGEGFGRAFPEFADYLDTKLAEHAARLEADDVDTPDHVMTGLIRSDLSRRQQRAMVRNLITGGLTTTSQLLGNLIDLVLTDPDADAALRAGALPAAIEESLRLRPPVMFIPRGCTGDVDVGGYPLAGGTRVIVGVASANRDERLFPDADAYHWDRARPDAHLTFGYGRHACPGATLARTVTRLGMQTLFDRFPPGSVRAAPGYTFENVPTFFECGPRRLPVLYEELRGGTAPSRN
jgi:cytochrome P450